MDRRETPGAQAPGPYGSPKGSGGGLAGTGAALASGLLLALTTSGTILGERITAGNGHVAVAANALVTLVSIVVLVVMVKRMRPASLVAQGVGAVLGIALVHGLVLHRYADQLPWLSERPAQLVNDATAVAATLILIWACAKQLDARVFFGALVLVTIYRATAARWHLDHAPTGFQTTVQELVVMQFAGSSIGLLLFSYLARRRSQGST